MDRQELHRFAALDGHPLTLLRIRAAAEPTRGPVLLVHGAGVRAEIFRPPTQRHFVQTLLERGHDVWLSNWRASIDLNPGDWTLDEAAAFDHPATVAEVLRLSGAPSLKAVIHCQGSTSFMMSAVAGLLPQVDTIVANAVSLHPVVNRIARLKSRWAVPMVRRLTPVLDPRWGEQAPAGVPSLLKALVRLTHHECDNAVCRFSSFTYGWGFPVLWRHENLDEATHDWIRGEFGAVPLSFFEQMRDCIEAGHLVSSRQRPTPAGLPGDYLAAPPKNTARIAFIAGRMNQCFDWHGQQLSHDWLHHHQPDRGHTLRVIERYGHLDIFLGRHADRDVFPTLIEELER